MVGIAFLPTLPRGESDAERMNILVLGGGGREHALTWAIRQNPRCDGLFCAPGNAGIAEVAACHEFDIVDGAAVVGFCRRHAIDFVIIGPEAPLAAGVADELRSAGTDVFGPGASAARLEASKAFTKDICDKAGIPTASYATFSQLEAAREHVISRGAPIVVKADGLEGGKGVTVADSVNDALAALDRTFASGADEPGATVVIEECLEGDEASFFVLADGKTVLPIGTAQDHKRAYDGDRGPNTGGMGACSPASVMTEDVEKAALDDIIGPTLAELDRRGIAFQGVLYAGLMIKDGKPKLLEYNVRFGDPECQVLMVRLGAQALDAMLACARGELDSVRLQWAPDHAVSVVLASAGYPDAYEKDSIIKGLDRLNQSSRLRVFHAGTRRTEAGIAAAGGRVLNVTARAESMESARNRAYRAINRIDWPGGFCRKDIGLCGPSGPG